MSRTVCPCGMRLHPMEDVVPYSLAWHKIHRDQHLQAFPDVDEGTRRNLDNNIRQSADVTFTGLIGLSARIRSGGAGVRQWVCPDCGEHGPFGHTECNTRQCPYVVKATVGDVVFTRTNEGGEPYQCIWSGDHEGPHQCEDPAVRVGDA